MNALMTKVAAARWKKELAKSKDPAKSFAIMQGVNRSKPSSGKGMMGRGLASIKDSGKLGLSNRGFNKLRAKRMTGGAGLRGYMKQRKVPYNVDSIKSHYKSKSPGSRVF